MLEPNELYAWEAGEVDEYVDPYDMCNPTVSELRTIEYDFHEWLEEQACRFFQPEDFEKWSDDDWWSFRERIGI